MGIVGNEPLFPEVQEIVNGPSQPAYYHKSCTINGRHYRIGSVDENTPITTNSSNTTPSYIDCIARKNDPPLQQNTSFTTGFFNFYKLGEFTPSYILHTCAFGTYLLGGLFTL